MTKRFKILLLLIAVLVVGIVLIRGFTQDRMPAAGNVNQSRLTHAASEPGNWMTHGGTYDEQRFSTLGQIDAGNVGRLGLAWSHEFDTNRGQEATPLVVDGVMYVSTAWSKVEALDARTGRLIWHFDPKVPGPRAFSACCDVVNRGVAVWKGKVFVGTIDGRLIAIDAASGRQSWSVQTTDPTKPYTITGAPRVFKDKVVIGNGGADLGVRGYVTAYDTASGKRVWRFYTVPGDPAKGPDHAASDAILAKARGSWAGRWYDYGGGGTVWDSIVYDPDLDQLYIGVGNGSPWNRRIRSEGRGDNLFLASIVALDPDTGRYRWHYQASPGDSWDYTSTSPMMLATIRIDGSARKVLMQAPKNGFFYVLDRQTGKLLSADGFAPQSWVQKVDLATGRPVMAPDAYYEEDSTLIQPSSLGAHNWHPMSYSPRTGLVYIPVQQFAARYSQDPDYKFRPGRWNQGLRYGLAEGNLGRRSGALIAWDPVRKREIWRVAQPELTNGGTLATAGGLVFSGNAHGEFDAFRADTGRKLWSYKQPAGIVAGPVSYVVDGIQYIAVLAGSGGAGPLWLRDETRPQQAQPNGRVLVFKLGGTAALPKVDLTLPPPNPPAGAFTTAQVKEGARYYFSNCVVCHGGAVLPDLRRSGALADREAWQSIVIGGALSANGMVSFAPWLTPAQAEAIRAYMGEEARKLQDTSQDRGRPD